MREPNVPGDSPENVGFLFQKNLGVAIVNENTSPKFNSVPGKFTLCGLNSTERRTAEVSGQDFVHFFLVSEVLGERQEGRADHRATGLRCRNGFIANSSADLVIEALGFPALLLVLIQFLQFHHLLALGVGALHVKVVVHSHQCLTPDGHYLAFAAVRALGGR